MELIGIDVKTLAKKISGEVFNIRDRIELGLNYLTKMLDSDMDFLPYFDVFLTDPPEACHDWPDFGDITGRFLEAILLSKDITGKEMDEEKYLKKLFISFFNEPDGLCYRQKTEWNRKDVQIFDQSRALFTLVTWYRKEGDNRVKDLIERMIYGLYSIAEKERSSYRFKHLWYLPPGTPNRGIETAHPCDSGIMIQPLLECYKVTKIQQAFDLAEGLINYIVAQNEYKEDGSFSGHFHSHSAIAEGLGTYGIMTKDKKVIEWVRNIYEFAKSQGTPFGWFREVVGRKDDFIGCETCCITDMINIGLLLTKAGYEEYWDDIQRFSKNHLFESQILSNEWLRESQELSDTKRGTFRNVKERIIGGFAGWSAPNDILAYEESFDSDRFENIPPGYFNRKVRLLQSCCSPAGVKALCAVWNNILKKENERVYVNLLFDHESEWVGIKNFIPKEGMVSIQIYDCPILYLRLPDWVQLDSVNIIKNRMPYSYRQEGRYIVIINLSRGDRIEVNFNLPRKEESIILGNEGFKMNTYKCTWVGDTIIEMNPRGKYFHLYDRSKKVS